MTRSSGPKWPCCRRMDRRTPTRTRTPLIEHRTHPSGDLDHPSLLPPPFIPCGLPLTLSLSSFNLSITCKKSRLRREGVATSAGVLPTVSCTVRGQRPKRYAMQRRSKGPRRLLEGTVGWRRCTLSGTGSGRCTLHGAQLRKRVREMHCCAARPPPSFSLAPSCSVLTGKVKQDQGKSDLRNGTNAQGRLMDMTPREVSRLRGGE